MDDFNYNEKDKRENNQINEPNRNLNITPIDSNISRDEEIAQELTPEDIEENDGSAIESNNTIGWIAIALSVISLFIMPVILGATGIIVGFVSRNRGSEWLGNTAIAVGIISILFSLFIRPVA